MNSDSVFGKKGFVPTPSMKLIKGVEGATCLCYQLRIHGKLHFVKKIKPEFENEARMRAAFLKENELGYSLSHPNLPKYVFLDGFLSPEEYVVTEWIDGQSLDSFLKNNRDYFKNKDNLLRFIREMSETLDYLHNYGVVHGDLKPSNIMIAANTNNAKVLDLGFAKTDAHTLTVGFSSSYASPEIIRGRESNTASDYYSLGKILEFIEIKIGKKLPSEISNLKKDLLSEDPRKRPVGLSLVNRYFQSHKRIIVLVSSLLYLILVSIYIYFSIERDDTNKIQEESLVIEQGEKSLLPVEPEDVSENNVPVKIVEEPIKEKLNIPTQKDTIIQEIEYEYSLIREVDRMIKSYYVPVLTSIDSLNNIGDFSSESMKNISDRHLAATLTIFNSSHYEKLFPRIPGERLVFMVNSRIKIYSDSVYMPLYMKYAQDVIDHHKTPSLD